MRRTCVAVCGCLVLVGCGLNASTANAVNDYYFPGWQDAEPAVVAIDHLSTPASEHHAVHVASVPTGGINTSLRGDGVISDTDHFELDVRYKQGVSIPSPFHDLRAGDWAHRPAAAE